MMSALARDKDGIAIIDNIRPNVIINERLGQTVGMHVSLKRNKHDVLTDSTWYVDLQVRLPNPHVRMYVV